MSMMSGIPCNDVMAGWYSCFGQCRFAEAIRPSGTTSCRRALPPAREC
jgi:hypothetical protein